MDIDTTYLKRAQRLVRDAKERAYSTKTNVAWANYWTRVTKTRLKVTFGSGAILLRIDREASRLVPGVSPRDVTRSGYHGHGPQDRDHLLHSGQQTARV